MAIPMPNAGIPYAKLAILGVEVAKLGAPMKIDINPVIAKIKPTILPTSSASIAIIRSIAYFVLNRSFQKSELKR
jgi:hypothetical protein